MIEAFYQQIKEFGVRISTDSIGIETYIVFGTQVDVYIRDGKPETIVVSK